MQNRNGYYFSTEQKVEGSIAIELAKLIADSPNGWIAITKLYDKELPDTITLTDYKHYLISTLQVENERNFMCSIFDMIQSSICRHLS